MKRAGELINKIAAPDNLRLAFWKARKGKDGKAEVIAYRKKLDKNLLLLREQILTGNVVLGNYHFFTIYDPKEREICAASFSERVLHHALMNVCDAYFEQYQIFDSYATRRQKGTYAALERAASFQKKYKWFLKLDVRKYFDNIDQKVLLSLLERRFKDKKLLLIFERLIHSYQVKEGKGVPIGNLTSQYFANYYLAFADRYIKEELKIPAYVRYMDDMILWTNDKQYLLVVAQKVELFLKEKLKLSLKIKFVNKNTHGLSFVGYRIFDGYILLSLRSKRRFKQKMKVYHQNFRSGKWSEEEYQRHLLPLISFTEYAETKDFRKKVFEKIGE